ncbi:MAG: PIN domain-containing protein [Acidobacteriota bacterium]|nr:PIN domain-containing protein [Acidobacteriota bacterium]
MTPCLLDVNVLIALLWPAHEAHSAAQAWFARSPRRKWATCPLTQAGFVRIVSNPGFSPQAVSPAQALDVLAANIAHPQHLFWPDSLSVADAVGPFRAKLTGHRQITDAYLLGLALQKKASFVTFDRGILSRAAAQNSRSNVELLSTGG